jgi:tetrapyrrole methylase family protein / MazG family protein
MPHLAVIVLNKNPYYNGELKMGQTDKHVNDPFWDLVAISQVLQAPGGCPWDREQTLQSLLPCLIEEAWEVHETVRKHSSEAEALEEELGDLLYTTLFMAMRGEQAGQLSVSRMLDRTRQKMIRRHPHVFGSRNAKTAAEAYSRWQEIKKGEKPSRKGPAKKLSKLLVQVWDYLLEEKNGRQALQSLVKKISKTRPRR